MFFRILKKDLKHKRGINIILFLFMLMATVFVVSSINNILVVSDATKYCMEKGNVPEMFISTYESADEKNLDSWLKNNRLVKNYSKNEAVIISRGNIDSFAGKCGDEYNINSTIMVQKQWKEHMLVFDSEGKEISVSDGEIAIQKEAMDNNNLKLNDVITMKFGDLYKNFKITQEIMDPAFGSELVGMTRYIISDKDYEQIKNTGMSINYNYGIETDNYKELLQQINKEAFNVIAIIDRDMFEFAYVIHMITAGILIIVGVCLIVIAFLILRFTIVFTLKEDYKEIGIMKAIGIRNYTIKKIYLVKYMALISVAAILGFVISIPVSNAMLSSMKKVILLKSTSANLLINILCAVLVAAIVLIMCYLCTNKLKKYSAVDAIRSGETGERFNKKSIMTLSKRKYMSTPLFMAVNDILSNPRRYLVLILTFIIGIVIIILPVNTITTFGSKEMAKNFVLDTDAAFYINSDIKSDDAAKSLNKQFIENQVKQVEDNFKDKGYDVSINTLVMCQTSFYFENEDNAYQFMSIIPVNSDGKYIQLVKGTTPERKDEIAFSEKALDKMGLKIGDTVYAKVNGESQKFIITASYQNYMQMGESALFSSKFECGDMRLSGEWMLQVYDNDNSICDQSLETVKDTFSEYTIYSMQEAMNSQLGSAASQIESVKIILIAVVCLVNVLITVLMMKIFVLGEKSQIALLRSMGYSLKAVRMWQMLRFVIILGISMVLGVLLSLPLNNIALRPVFGMMGATHIRIETNPLEVYLMYPLLLFVVIMAAAFISSLSLKKLNIMEINNQE